MNKASMFDFLYILKGLKTIFSPGLKRYVILPLIISSTLLFLFGWIAVAQFESTLQWLLPEDSWMQIFSWILWPVFALTFMVIVFYGFTIVANLVGAPFNSKLAEAVAAKLDPELQLAETDSLLRDISQSIGSEIRKILYYISRAIPLLIIAIIPIPGLNVLGSIAWLLFSIWFLALEYTAYPLENRKLLFSDQKKLLRKKPVSALSLGGGITLLLLIPVLNLAAMPAAVAGATIYWHEKLRQTD